MPEPQKSKSDKCEKCVNILGGIFSIALAVLEICSFFVIKKKKPNKPVILREEPCDVSENTCVVQPL